jgi:tryptophan-rich sensory protein
MKKLLQLIFAVLVCQTAGLIGSIFTRMSLDPWYASLEKPFFTPPDFVFAPVWIVLYTIMGVSAFLVWNRGITSARNKASLIIFTLHLCVNIAWTAVFFGAQCPPGGAALILLLWIMILTLISLFWRISPAAGALLIPYLAWVSFASALNIAIAMLN